MRYMCNSCGAEVGGPGQVCAEHPAARINPEPDACGRLYRDRVTGFTRLCGRPQGHPGEHHGAGLAVSASLRR